MYQTDSTRSPKEYLPTMYDLKSEDPEEPGLPDQFHELQPQLLRETFRPPTYSPEWVFMASDMNLYYDVSHPLWYKRPDWFGVVGVPQLYQQRDLRLSYVIWQEGVTPSVVVELLSPGTEKEDLGQTRQELNEPPTKWQVYEQILRVPYYVVFDRYTDQLRGFEWVDGYYREMSLNQPRVWMPTLELGLGVWLGFFQGIERLWLRWYDAQDNWIPTSTEREAQEAQQARLLLEQERQRSQRLAERLRVMGIDPEVTE